MPENANLNSVRMQRAQRINSIEDSLLSTKICVIDKQRRHQIRIANQDIRMVNLTLEYINSSSGYSPEALPPDYVDPPEEKVQEPYFMYGERLRRLKSRRIQSAPSISIKPEDEEDTSGIGSKSFTKNTQKKQAWGSANFPMEKIREHKNAMENASAVTISARIRPATSYTQQTLLTVQDLPRAYSEQDLLSENGITLMHEEAQRSLKSSREELEAVKQERKHTPHGGKANITLAVNKVRVMATSVKRMRYLTPMQVLVKPLTKTLRQKKTWDEKLSLNLERKQKLDAKLKIFMKNYPTVHTFEIPNCIR